MKVYIKHSVRYFVIFVFLTFGLMPLVGCSNEQDNLTDAVEDAWGAIEDEIETSAEEALEDFADNPEKLYNGDCETSYITLGDIFTLRIPIDYSSQAAVGLLFGSDAAEFMSLIESSKRNSQSKSDIKKLILKNFNPSWADMMTALVILDGEFDYDFENDDWLDASYDFDAKALYKILNEKGYFDGGYRDPLPSTETESSNSSDTSSTNSSGHQIIHGNAIASEGKEYPFRVEFDQYAGRISNAKYYNPIYSTTVNLSHATLQDGEYNFSGNLGKETLTLIFSSSQPYSGTLTQGKTTLPVRMNR